MHAVIPVAGKGTRLRPHTYSMAKPLLPVAGKPILGHIMDSLIDAGITEVTLIVGYRGDSIVEWVSDNYGVKVNWAEQEVMDGLGSAIGLASPHLDDSPVLVILGDTIIDADLSAVPDSNVNIIGARRVDDPRRFGVIVTEGDRVVKLVEKPQQFVSDLAIVGIYYFRSGTILADSIRRLVDSGIRTRGEFQLTDAMQIMLDDGEPFGTFEVDGWFDCGKPETMLETNRALLDRKGSICLSDTSEATIIEPVHIGRDVNILSSTIGPYVSVGDGSDIRGSTVRDSIVFDDVVIRSSVLGGSLLGTGVEVSGGSGALNIGDSSTVIVS